MKCQSLDSLRNFDDKHTAGIDPGFYEKDLTQEGKTY